MTVLREARRKTSKKDNLAAYLFLAPWLLGLVLITVGPMVASFVLSFTEHNLLQPPKWAAFDNFVRMLSDERLHHALQVTFVYVLVSVPLQLGLALLLAVVLDRGVRGMAFYRSVFYLPSLLGSSVAIAMLWKQVFGSDGLVNHLLGLFGVPGRGWISEPETALSSLIVLNVWTFGAPMVIFLAGLRQIPAMYYEAAAVDGAGPLRRFRSVTLPLLTPIIFFNLVLQIIHAFQAFTQAFVVSNGTGGPSDSTLFITVYIYQRAFANFDMGYAGAGGAAVLHRRDDRHVVGLVVRHVGGLARAGVPRVPGRAEIPGAGHRDDGDQVASMSACTVWVSWKLR